MKHKKLESVLFLCILCGAFWLGYNIYREENLPTAFPPIVCVADMLYFHSGQAISDPNPEYLSQIGYITEEVSPLQAPTKNFQANHLIKGAPVYKCTDKSLYEKKILLSGDILIYYDNKYCIYELGEHRQAPFERVSEQK